MGRYDFLLHGNQGVPTAPPQSQAADPAVDPATNTAHPPPSHAARQTAVGQPASHAAEPDVQPNPQLTRAPIRATMPKTPLAISQSETRHPHGAHSTTEPRNRGTTEADTPFSRPDPRAASKHAASPPREASPQDQAGTQAGFYFDMSAKADQKYTLAFTDEELEAIEDVKLELRRRFDVRTSKVEIVRCGLWDLIQDYQRHAEQSRLVKRLKARPRSDS